MNDIPAMTHEYGKYWDQPADIRSAPMDETHVLLTAAQIMWLPEYSASLPSGVYPGKCWLWKQHPKYGRDRYLLWYGDYVAPNEVSVNKRKILEVD